MAAGGSSGRLILVSNRLPVTVRQKEDGDIEYYASAGGLITGLSGLLKARPFQWYGWPGISAANVPLAALEKELKAEYGVSAIWLDAHLARLHYDGFSNSILWPLLHYRTDGLDFDEATWRAYVQVNEIFANVIEGDLQSGDIVWIHDYHLFLVPQMLRERIFLRSAGTAKVKIGFFLHTPFPAADIFSILPTAASIMASLMNCDLVGFHIQSYATNFSEACERLTGAIVTPGGLLYNGRFVRIGTFPIGIDPGKFHHGLKQEMVKTRIENLRRMFRGQKLICGVDRLDFIKGLPQKLRAFDMFLTRHPEWLGKVSLAQVVVPSRGTLRENKDLKDEIDMLARRINEKYKTLGYMPVHVIHRQVGFEELLALYTGSDACAIASLRDGMNLVASEYVAGQRHSKGVLILSELSGAAECLRGSLQINPYDTRQIADAFHQALTMDATERNARWQDLYKHVALNTSTAWGRAFISSLENGYALTSRRRSLAELAGQDMSEYYAS